MKIETELKNYKFKSEIHKLNLNLMFTAGKVKSKINKNLKPLNLTIEQYNLMRILWMRHPEPMCGKEIAFLMLDDNSNITRIIDKLETKELISICKSEADKRELNIRLTESGAELLKEAEAISFCEESMICVFSETEASLLNAYLDKYRENLNSKKVMSYEL